MPRRAVNPAGAHEALVDQERWLPRVREALAISIPSQLMCISRLDAGLSQSVSALVGEEVLIAVPVDVARADQPLDLLWRQLLASSLPLQLSDDLVHATSIMNALRIAVTSGRFALHISGVRLGAVDCVDRALDRGPQPCNLHFASESP